MRAAWCRAGNFFSAQALASNELIVRIGRRSEPNYESKQVRHQEAQEGYCRLAKARDEQAMDEVIGTA